MSTGCRKNALCLVRHLILSHPLHVCGYAAYVPRMFSAYFDKFRILSRIFVSERSAYFKKKVPL